MNKSVTIVIPVHNRPQLIRRCLDSVRAQSWRPLRVIVVDNASTDATSDSVRQWVEDNKVSEDPDAAFSLSLLSESTPGASAARNCGLAHVTTEWTIFFDSDDVMLPSLVSDAFAKLEEDRARNKETADLVVWKARYVEENGFSHPRTFPRGRDWLAEHAYRCMLSTQCYMAKTEIFRKAGGWNEKALVWNDWELGLRIILESPDVELLPKEEVIIYPQKKSITGTSLSARAGEWEKTLGLAAQYVTGILDKTLRHRALLMISYRYMNLAALYSKEGRSDLSASNMEKALSLLTALGSLRLRKGWLRLLWRYTRLGGRAAYFFWPTK